MGYIATLPDGRQIYIFAFDVYEDDEDPPEEPEPEPPAAKSPPPPCI